MPADAKKGTRWTRQANIARYLRILKTPLTDLERRYVEQRLAEERAVDKLITREEMPPKSNAARNGTPNQQVL